LAALGNTTGQIAARMGIAARTVERHLQHVYAKLGARSLAQAASTAWAAVGIQQAAKPESTLDFDPQASSLGTWAVNRAQGVLRAL
jgi:hypothetical protein